MFLTVRMPDGTHPSPGGAGGLARHGGDPRLGPCRIKAECGGACACATCHVWVGEDWLAKLAPPTSEELEMLDGAFNVDERSRLCCQIIMSKELDGLEVELAPESLADTPAERAGGGRIAPCGPSPFLSASTASRRS